MNIYVSENASVEENTKITHKQSPKLNITKDD